MKRIQTDLCPELLNFSPHVSSLFLVLGNLSPVLLNVTALSTELPCNVILHDAELQVGVLGQNGKHHQRRQQVASLYVLQHCSHLSSRTGASG